MRDPWEKYNGSMVQCGAQKAQETTPQDSGTKQLIQAYIVQLLVGNLLSTLERWKVTICLVSNVVSTLVFSLV
jgi:hypothetical protein